MPRLTVMCGIPGSGKSTWAAAHPELGVHLTADACRLQGADPGDVMAELYSAAVHRLMAGADVIVDACNTQPWWRSRWSAVGRALDVEAHLVLVHCDVRLAVSRDLARPRGQRVGPQAVRAYASDFISLIRALPLEQPLWASLTHVRTDGC